MTYTMGRDLAPGKLEDVLAALNDWSIFLSFAREKRRVVVDTFIFRASTTSSVLSALDAKLNSIAAQSAAHKQHQHDYERQLQSNLREVHEKQQKEKGATGGDRGGLARRGTLQFDRERENMMEVDELDPKGKGRKFMYVFSFYSDRRWG